MPFGELPQLLRAGDLVSSTMRRRCRHRSFGHDRDAARRSSSGLSAPIAGSRLHGVLLGAGDYHTRTEDRPRATARSRSAIACAFGAIDAIVESIAGRRVTLVAQLSDDELWQALYAAGKPVQYAHRTEPLPLYAVQTAYAARPWAVEMPSAGRALTWDVLLGLRRAGIQRRDADPCRRPVVDRRRRARSRAAVARALRDSAAHARRDPRRDTARGNRVIAIGTTVVRALESAALAAESHEAPLARRRLRHRDTAPRSRLPTRA